MRCVVLIALALSSINCWAADKAVSIETIARIKRAIVPIVCGYTDENKHFQLVAIAGSGFFVDHFGRFITAGHVFDDWDKISKTRRACTPAIYIPDHGWNKFEKKVPIESFTFVTCSRDSAIDLGVCQPIENPFTSQRIPRGNIESVTFETKELREGTGVAFTGFPLEYVFPITSKGNIAGLMEIDGSDTGFDYLIDKATWPGASGSLVYLPNGKVIGIILRRGQNEGGGLAYARSATVIVDFLAKHPYRPKGQNDNQQH